MFQLIALGENSALVVTSFMKSDSGFRQKRKLGMKSAARKLLKDIYLYNAAIALIDGLGLFGRFLKRKWSALIGGFLNTIPKPNL